MAGTMLEQTRDTHASETRLHTATAAGLEEKERLEHLIVKDFKNDAKGHKERLIQGHRVRERLEELQSQAAKLVKIFEDEDGIRREEIAALRGDDMYRTFYERLKEVRDYHRRHPSTEVTEAEDEDAILAAEPKVDFSGEEGGGRYLDLHTHFHTFVNSKFKRDLSYPEYAVAFDDFKDIPRQHRISRPYRSYLESLLEYLQDFYVRTQPLQALDKVFKPLDSFDEDFEEGRVGGWEDSGESRLASEAEGQIDLDAFDSVEELLTLGMDKLKEALAALGLKTGGTLQQRAERLWLTKATPLEKLDRKHFAKGLAPARAPEELQRQRNFAKGIALLEAKIAAVKAALGNVPEETRGNVEKKQARTYEELQAEQAEQEQAEAPSDSEEEDEFVYNPLKLPLGYDGKPIPYWLYKLHGLNQEFKCEICGDYTYRGRREFERHFKEWRHQNQMRALGIPNNKNFYEITKIQEALELWQNIQERQKGGFKKEVEEEFEDDQGNVYNRKTYEDLKRQGLI